MELLKTIRNVDKGVLYIGCSDAEELGVGSGRVFKMDLMTGEYDLSDIFGLGCHYVEISPDGTLGCVGTETNMAKELIFFDPKTLKLLNKIHTEGSSPAHFRFTADREIYTAFNKAIWKINTDIRKPEKVIDLPFEKPHDVKITGDWLVVVELKPGKENSPFCYNLKTEDSKSFNLGINHHHIGVGHCHDVNKIIAPSFEGGKINANIMHIINIETGEITKYFYGRDLPRYAPVDISYYNGRAYVSYIASAGVSEFDLNQNEELNFIDLKSPFLDILNRETLMESIRHFLALGGKSNTFGDFVSRVVNDTVVRRNGPFLGAAANQVTSDGKYLVTANRGGNNINIIERDSFQPVMQTIIPKLNNRPIGFTHGYIHHT